MVIDKIIFGGSMEEKHMKEKKIIIGVMCALICIMGVAYAAFATNLVINGTASIKSTWSVVFTKIEEVSKTSGVTITEEPTASGTSATFNVDLKSPGDYIEYQITVANQGTLNAVIEEITASETGSDAIKFEITNIKTGDKLAKGESTSFNVKIEYDESITSQPSITTNELTVNITYVQDLGQEIIPSTPNIESIAGVPISAKLASAIGSAKSDENINFGEVGNGNGMYYTNSNTEGGKTVYYYRGAIDNNYVKMGTRTVNTCTYNGKDVINLNRETFVFEYNTTEEQCTATNVCAAEGLGIYATGVDSATCAELGGTLLSAKATYTKNVTEDILWRIVRVNEDGSIRLVTEKAMGSSAFNTEYQDNAYVGYMYGTPGSSTYKLTHENKYNSAIKNYLDNWYTSNLSRYSGIISHEAGFCNDRSVTYGSGIGTEYTDYGALDRLPSNPQFKCPNTTDDLFTTSSSSIGNKKLTNPIGLLTVDELVYAGGVPYETNPNYYLSNGTLYWTMSPAGFGGGSAAVWDGSVGGRVFSNHVYNGLGVRPAVNLKSSTPIISGDGSLGTPYVVKAS